MIQNQSLRPLLLSATVGLALACAPQAEQSGTTETEAPPAAATDDQAGPVAGELTLTPLGESPQFPDAKLTLNGYSDDTGVFDFAVEGYELGAQTEDAATKGIANSSDGQHIHLIVDNGPYSAHYAEHVQTELEPGHHVVLAFLSRSYHESVKSPGAMVLTEVSHRVEGESDTGFDPQAPHLFYSRPKGAYSGGDIERLMLDFYLVNTDLAPDGNRVKATINGQEFWIDQWQPYVIEGLTPGEVTVELELIDADGEPVPGPFNQVSRTVTLEAGA